MTSPIICPFCETEIAIPALAPSAAPVVKGPGTGFNQYRRKQIAELRPYFPGELLPGVSISDEDRKAGSPRLGDMIARNPKNHADQWLVAAQYFADNFEPAPKAALAPSPVEPRDSLQSQVQALQAEVERLTKERDQSREQTTAAIEDYNDELSARRAAEAQVQSLTQALAETREDAARLDWLDSVNLHVNERNGTIYGWKYDINHNRASLTDHNLPALSVREAIDSARYPERSKQIAAASMQENARLKAFDEEFPGLRARALQSKGDANG